jgi:hypothetical protein
MRRYLPAAALAAAAIMAAATACTASSDQHTPPPGAAQAAATAHPETFDTKITNRYLPLEVGRVWKYNETEDGETNHITVTVTNRTHRTASGITAIVVTDVARNEDGDTEETTLDYYAQDQHGNVWYLGEDTKALQDDGTYTTEGSWEDGVKGAHRGIAFPGHPVAGQHYRQEYLKGHAEDAATVLSAGTQAQTSAGHWTRCILTEETTRIEPKSAELKINCPGIGQVSAYDVSGGSAVELLTSLTQ